MNSKQRLYLLLPVLLLVLLVACQAPTAQDPAGGTSEPVSTTAPATATDVPEIAVTETVEMPAETPSAVETATAPPTTVTETATPEVMAPAGFDYLVDPYFDESGGWQLRGARRAASGGWETILVPLGESVSVGGVDYAPATHRALVWDYSANQGAGPGNLSAGPLYLVDLATGSVETLFPGDVVSARLAPGGQGYAYLLATAETYELHVREGGEDRVVARDVPREFTFAPDGSAIAFTRESGYGLPGAPGLYVVDLATGAEQLLNDVDRAGTGGSGAGWAPLWSPDGASLLLRAFADGSNRLVWAARDGSWSHALLLEDLDSAAAAALDQENICNNQEFLPTGPTTLLLGAGPCAEEPLMGATPEATHLVLLQLDPAQGTLSPAGTLPAPVATFFFLGYSPQGNSVVLHSPAGPVNTAIHEVVLP